MTAASEAPVARALGTRRPERGQSFAELGIVMVLFVFLVMGIIEFGRDFMITNMVTHAARDGARAASTVPSSNRNAAGAINTTAKNQITASVRAQIGNVMDASSLAITVDQGPPVGAAGNCFGITNSVCVTVSGSVNWIFRVVPGQGTSFSITRTATFRDEA